MCFLTDVVHTILHFSSYVNVGRDSRKYLRVDCGIVISWSPAIKNSLSVPYTNPLSSHMYYTCRVLSLTQMHCDAMHIAVSYSVTLLFILRH